MGFCCCGKDTRPSATSLEHQRVNNKSETGAVSASAPPSFLFSLLSCQGLQLLQFRSFVAVVVCLWNMLIYILEAVKNKGPGNWFASASLVSSRGFWGQNMGRLDWRLFFYFHFDRKYTYMCVCESVYCLCELNPLWLFTRYLLLVTLQRDFLRGMPRDTCCQLFFNAICCVYMMAIEF